MKLNKMAFVGMLVAIFCSLSLSAKEEPPALLIYGSSVEAFTAAIQGARSNVPTLWIIDTDRIVTELTQKPLQIEANGDLDGGIWMNLLMNVAISTNANDSLARIVKHDINPTLMLNAIEKMVSKEQKLTVIRNRKIKSLVRNKKGWTVLLEDNKEYEVRTVVDASSEGELRTRVMKSSVTLQPVKQNVADTLSAQQIRTTIAIGEYRDTCYAVLVKDVLAQNFQELFFIQSLISSSKEAESIPFRAHVGQGVGALAAYCAFFKTTADKVDVRKLQTELMTFGARLLPWRDVSQQDPNYAAIEKGYLATILAGKENNQQFDATDSVTVASVKPIFNQLYSRSQLWFIDHTAEVFSLADLLFFIKFISFRGSEIEVQIQKDWTKRLKFQGEYDLDRVVNRYEFLTLINKYADPYAKTVTVGGDIVR